MDLKGWEKLCNMGPSVRIFRRRFSEGVPSATRPRPPPGRPVQGTPGTLTPESQGCDSAMRQFASSPQGRLEIKLQLQQVLQIYLSSIVDNVLIVQQTGVVDTGRNPSPQRNLHPVQRNTS